jgi:ParB family chromosome partitioning protein
MEREDRVYSFPHLCRRAETAAGAEPAVQPKDNTIMSTNKASNKSKTALPGKRGNVVNMDPWDLTIIGLDTEDGPEHPLYDERIKSPVDEGMVRNIMFQGVIEPIIVRKNGTVFEVVAGRSRVRACREANARLKVEGKELILVLAMNRRGTDADMMGVRISENEIRKGDTPLVKARNVQRLINQGRTEDECAVVFGVNVKSIKTWLSLLDCDEKVLAAVENNTLSATAAAKISVLPRAEQREQLQAMVVSGATTTQHAAAVARTKKDPKIGSGQEPKAIEEGIIIPPGKKTITRVLAAVDDGYELDPNVVKALKWIAGLSEPRTVKGLVKILNRIDADIAEKQAKLANREEQASERAAKKAEKDAARAAKQEEREAKRVEKEAKQAERAAKREAREAKRAEKEAKAAGAKRHGAAPKKKK